ncbi:MAG: hypothetical protein JRF63_02735 [Deltaproteobacteria bacterium]|nr:hypothetical protein [Deltaproteobacteria bacterium]
MNEGQGGAVDQARAIACEACGANLPIRLDASSIPCEQCGAEHRVSDADRQLMQSVAAELRQTDALSNAAEGIRKKLLKPTIKVLFDGPVASVFLILWIMVGWAFGSMVGEFTMPAIFARGNMFILSTFVMFLPVMVLCFSVFAIWKSRSLRKFRTAAAALPPLAGGTGLRCRTCGSDLGAGSDQRAFVVCEHCQTQNLIGLDEVRRREEQTRARGEQKLEELRTTETKIGNRFVVLIASLVLMPIVLGIVLNPLQKRVLIALFPLMPPPAEPRPWIEQPSKLALEVPPDPRQPWPIVWVSSHQPAAQVKVFQLGQARIVDVARLRQFPLKMGLRVMDLTNPQRGVGIIGDWKELLFPDGAYKDLEGYMDSIRPLRWAQMAAVPPWGDVAEYDEYFDWVVPPTEPPEAVQSLIADRSEFTMPHLVWATGVHLFSSQYKPQGQGYDATQVLGVPDVYPSHKDSASAWAPAGQDGTQEWIVVSFDPPLQATGIVVVETFNPGAVVRIDDMSNDAVPVPLWFGASPPAAQARVLLLNLSERRLISSVRVVLDTSRVAGWNEIDGIGLVVRQ